MRRLTTALLLLTTLAFPYSASAQPTHSPSAISSPQARALTLTDALQTLEARNIGVRIAQSEVERAALLEDRAWSLFLPSVNLGANYVYNNIENSFAASNPYTPLEPYLREVYSGSDALQNDPSAPSPDALTANPGGTTVLQYQHDYNASLTVNQPLFHAQAFAAMKQARIHRRLARTQADGSLLSARRELQRVYFQALSFQQFVKIQERVVDQNRQLLTIAEERHKEGVAQITDVDRARVNLARARRQLDNTRLSYKLTLEALATLLQTDADFDVVAPASLSIPTSPESLLRSAQETRPEVQAARIREELQEARVEEARAAWWPTLSAQLQGNHARAAGFGGENTTWRALATLSWDLYTGGARRAAVKTAELDRFQSALQREDATRRIEQELRQTWLQVKQAEKNVSSAQDEMELAARNLDRIKTSWSHGATPWTDVELAQTQHQSSELQWTDAQLTLQARLHDLMSIAGQPAP